jgi:hypothetical protein
MPTEETLSSICGWRTDLKTDRRGEFWVDRALLTQKMSSLSSSERSLFRWGIVEKFNQGLEEILVEDQAVGEMREDFKGQ